VGANHIFQATPTFYSNPTTLNGGMSVFSAEGMGSSVTGYAGGITLNQAVVKFTTAQTIGTIQIIQDFFNWILSIFH